MPAPRIVAKDHRDANRFAQETLGLRPNTFRIVSSAGALAGFGYTLHLAPGWEKHMHVHTIKNRLRFKRGIEIVDHSKSVETDENPVEMRHCEGCGEDYNAFEESHVGHEIDPEETDAATGTQEPGEDAEGSEKPKQRRRRCKTCGVLVEPSEVDAHAAEHAAE